MTNEPIVLSGFYEAHTSRALRDEADLYRQLFDASPDGMALVTTDGRIARANRALAEMHGYSSPQDIEGLEATSLVAPSSRERAECVIRQRLAGQYSEPIVEYELIRKDGTTCIGEIRATIVRDPDGNITGYVCSVRSTTDRVAMQAALVDSELRFRTAFEQSVLGMAHVGLNGNWLRVNQRLCTILGFSKEELLERTLFDQLHTTGTAATDEQLYRTLSGAVSAYSAEIAFTRKDESVIWTLFTCNAVYGVSGAPLYCNVIVEDITHRRQTDHQLELIKFSIDQAPHAAYWLDPHGKFIYVNQMGCTSLGYTREELAKLSVNAVNPRASPERWKETFEGLKKGPAVINSVHIKKDGTRFDVELTSSYFQLDGCEYCMGFAVDITERLREQRERESLQQQLNQAHKMESIGRLAGGVAHDFNNMLTIIQMGTQQALDELNSDLPIYADLLEVARATKRSADLTRQLLAFARKQSIAPRVLNLNEVIGGMLTLLKRLLGENLVLEWCPAPDLGQVFMDPSQVDQLLVNLCVNARDAISDFGQVTIATGNCGVAELAGIAETRSDDLRFVNIRVSDTGTGMDTETQAHIFEPFYTTKGPKGTGLGLATVYGIVKQNQGYVQVQSAPGQGSTFMIYLPHYVGADATDTPTPSIRPHHTTRRTVLVVEDESAILKLISRTLTRLGYAVIASESPKEALRLVLADHCSVDLLLSDIVMPEMNARALTDALKVSFPQLKCLYMSGYTSDVIARHQITDDENFAFIQKPFSIESLAAKVREVLGGSPERR